jgi:hypothetical protein
VVVTGAGAATTRPMLALADRDPLMISLRGFKPHETVKVTLQQPAVATRSVSTTLGGRALARFRNQTVDPCDSVRAVAAGNKGSRARLLVPEPGCPPITP